MTRLELDTALNAALAHPSETHQYYFDVSLNETATITFTAPLMEYAVTYAMKEHPLAKGGSMDAHQDSAIDFTVDNTFTFSGNTSYTVFLSVGSVSQSNLPSIGYVIIMSSE